MLGKAAEKWHKKYTSPNAEVLESKTIWNRRVF
jgi:hypothetical protein